jgi:hypothetical protein
MRKDLWLRATRLGRPPPPAASENWEGGSRVGLAAWPGGGPGCSRCKDLGQWGGRLFSLSCIGFSWEPGQRRPQEADRRCSVPGR